MIITDQMTHTGYLSEICISHVDLNKRISDSIAIFGNTHDNKPYTNLSF